jgi:hypothetical protein
MNRRGFLRAGGLATLGLLVGDQALEAFARLTHRRRLWPGADVGPITASEIVRRQHDAHAAMDEVWRRAGERLRWQYMHGLQLPNDVLLNWPAHLIDS